MIDDVEIPKHTVIQYVRDKKRVPYGVIVAVKNPADCSNSNGFTIGYSLCNKKDRFSKKMALKIALGRANIVPKACDEDTLGVGLSAHTIIKMIPAFTDRCKKYYKVTQK